MELLPFLLILAAAALGFWIQVLVYRWVKRRWPTVAKVLLALWLLNSAWQLYRLATGRRDK